VIVQASVGVSVVVKRVLYNAKVRALLSICIAPLTGTVPQLLVPDARYAKLLKLRGQQ
jgi:hypothetical protein